MFSNLLGVVEPEVTIVCSNDSRCSWYDYYQATYKCYPGGSCSFYTCGC